MYRQTNQDNSNWEWQKTSTKKQIKKNFLWRQKITEDAPGTQESYQMKNKKTQSIIQEK